MKFYFLITLSLLTFYVQGQLIPATAVCTKDTYVENLSAANNGSATALKIEVNTQYKRAYLKFDIASLGIPANAIIYSANILLKIVGETGVSGSSHLVQRITTSWPSNMIYSGEPTPVTSDQTSSSTPFLGYRYYDVLPQVKNIMLSPSLDEGFCIRWANESSITGACSYESMESTNKPTLFIQYYFPYQVSSALITPASTTSSMDAGIAPVVTGGPDGAINYQWFTSTGASLGSPTTVANLTGKTYGWYGLKITNSTGIGNPVYMAFLVGLKCQEATIDFSPGPDYVDDLSYINGLPQTFSPNSVTTSAGYDRPGSAYHYGTLMKFRLWVSPELDVTQANLNMYGASHSGTANTALLYQNTQGFDETPLFFGFYTFPANTATGGLTIAHKSTATANALNLDIKHFWNQWKINNNQNYGMTFKSATTSGFTSQMQTYHSSDAASSLRPNIQFKVNRPCPTFSYSQFKKEIDGGYATTSAGILKFYFEEAYAIAGKYIPLKIYDKNRALIAHVKLDGTIVTGAIVAQPYTYDDNRRSLSLTSLNLTYGEMYLLEAETSTGEKRYLKFIYKD